MASVGDVTTTLRADLGPLQTGLKQGAAEVRGFGRTVETGLSQAAGNGGRSLGRLGNAVSNLGLGLAGVHGPLQKVTEVLGAAAIGGGAFALGTIVVGGLVNKFREMKEAADQSAASIHRAADAVAYLSDTERRQLQRRLAEFQATRQSLLQELVTPGGPYGESMGERIRERINRFQAGMRPVGEVRADLAGVNLELVKLTAQLSAMDKGTEAVKDQTAAWSKLSGEMIRATQTAVEAAAVPFFLLGQTKPPEDMTPPGYTTEPYNPGYTPRILLGARQREGLIEQVDKDASQWQAVGLRVGEVVGDGLARGLARTLLEGGKTIGDTLKNVFHAILEEILVEIVKPFAKKVGKLIGDALSGGGLADGLGLGLLGGAIGIVGGFFGLSRASLSASTSQSGGTLVVPLSGLPPSPSPVVMARDAQHQMLWMETARVAQQLGWRVRLA